MVLCPAISAIVRLPEVESFNQNPVSDVRDIGRGGGINQQPRRTILGPRQKGPFVCRLNAHRQSEPHSSERATQGWNEAAKGGGGERGEGKQPCCTRRQGVCLQMDRSQLLIRSDLICARPFTFCEMLDCQEQFVPVKNGLAQ